MQVRGVIVTACARNGVTRWFHRSLPQFRAGVLASLSGSIALCALAMAGRPIVTAETAVRAGPSRNQTRSGRVSTLNNYIIPTKGHGNPLARSTQEGLSRARS